MESEIQMMEEEQQKANPLPPGTDSSANEPAGGTMSETTTMVIDSAGNSDVVASHVVNDVIATTTTQPKNTPVLQFELQMLKEDANPLSPGTDSSAHQQAGGTMSETTSTVMHSAGDSDVLASHVVNDVTATTTTTQPKNTQVLQMLEEEEPNTNPLPPGTDSSAHQPAGGTMSETTTMVIDSAGNSDVVASHVVNDVIATTTTQPKNTPVFQFELQMLKEDANPLPPGTDSSAHQQAGGTMSETTSTVMHSAGDSDVLASHVVNDVIATTTTTTTTTTQPKNTQVLQMLEEEEPNTNPLPPGTDSSAHQPAGGTMSETTSTAMHSAGDSDVVASHVVNDVIATTTKTQPKNTPVPRCEICNITCRTQNVLERHKLGKKHLKTLQKLAEASAVDKPAGGTMSETTSMVMHSAGDSKSDVVASLVVNDVIATTTTTTQPKNTPVLQCEICNVTCGTQGVLERHKLGKKHLKTLQKLAEASAIDKPLADTNGLKNATSECGSSSSSGKKSATFQCEVCKISCNSNELLNMHFSGKKHLKKLEQSEEIPDPPDQPESTEGKSELHQGKPLSCNLCGITCNSYDMLKKHNSGKKHQKNLEKSLKPIGPNPAPAMEPVATVPKMIGPLQDEGKMVKADGSNGKAKRARGHEDVVTKKQKLSQGGASNALSRCTLCHVVCTSPDLLISHFAGKKHLKLALKQAEAQFD